MLKKNIELKCLIVFQYSFLFPKPLILPQNVYFYPKMYALNMYALPPTCILLPKIYITFPKLLIISQSRRKIR